MNKIALSLIVASSLVLAADEALSEETVKAQIAEAKAQKSALDDKIKSLQTQLVHTTTLVNTKLGFMQTQGNTNTDTFNLGLNVKKGWSNVHLIEFSLDAQYATDDNVETKNKYTAELDYGYSFSDRLSATYLLGFKQDKFSGYDYQLYTGPGLKYLFIKTPQHKLSFEGSVLFSEDSIEDTEYDATGATISYPNASKTPVARTKSGYKEQYGAYRVKGVYGWQVFSNLKFNQDLSYRAEFENSEAFFVNSKSSLSSKFNSTFSAGVSYVIDYTNAPPSDKEHADKTFTVDLIIDY